MRCEMTATKLIICVLVILFVGFFLSYHIGVKYGYTNGKSDCPDVISEDRFDEGFNMAMTCMTLLNLELHLEGERKTFGEMSDICRERFGIEKPAEAKND